MGWVGVGMNEVAEMLTSNTHDFNVKYYGKNTMFHAIFLYTGGNLPDDVPYAPDSQEKVGGRLATHRMNTPTLGQRN